jgi:P27 family predicted phage terminase small subunit
VGISLDQSVQLKREVIVVSGQRGPKPLPSNVHMLRGNASKKPLASLLDDVVRPDVEIPDRPAHLEGEAAAEWDRLAPHLQSLGLISQIDRAALVGYCDTWGEYVWAVERIRVMNAEDASGERGRVWDTPSGYKQISVLQQIRNRSLEQMKSFLAMFGMSPSDRSRVTQSDPRTAEQLPLDGMPEKPKVGGWGDF